jgi:hypothetical protein
LYHNRDPVLARHKNPNGYLDLNCEPGFTIPLKVSRDGRAGFPTTSGVKTPRVTREFLAHLHKMFVGPEKADADQTAVAGVQVERLRGVSQGT